MNKFLLALLIVLPLLLIVSPARAEVASGFAWIGANNAAGGDTKPVGWVSFNSNSSGITCSSSGGEYAVDVNYNTEEINGRAWIGVGEDDDPTDCNTTESSVGFIDFTKSQSPPWGGNPAYIENKEIKGGAPIYSEDENGSQEVIAWVKFKGTNYSNVITSEGTIGDSDSSHYAWSGYGNEGGLGWIDMNPYRDDSNISGDERPPGLSEDDTVQFPEPNQAPQVTNLNPEEQRDAYCGNDPSHYFSWNFSDAEDSEQTAYQLRITANSNFDSTEKFNPGKIESPTESKYVSINNTDLEYNDDYYAWVKAWDSSDNESDWDKDYFSTPSHRYPSPYFSHSPSSPEGGTEVKFDEDSICYTSGSSNACSDPGFVYYDDIDYQWDMDYENNFAVSTTTKGDVYWTYASTTDDEIKVRLRVHDYSLDENPYCMFKETFNVILPLPKWREVGSD